MNSINWARIAAQVPYYAAAALALGAPDREVAFAVPTGNFGNVLAAWAARRMGLPVARLVVGSNRNDILARFLDANDMSMRPVEPSLSPSMDIQVSSNFERLLFELLDRDPAATAAAMTAFRRDGRMPVPEAAWHRARAVLHGFRLDDEGTIAEIARLHRACGYLADPHTAVGIAAARALPAGHGVPTVAMATAHPAKFPDAMERATGERPALPPPLADLFDARGAVHDGGKRIRRGARRGARAGEAKHGLSRRALHGRLPSSVGGAIRVVTARLGIADFRCGPWRSLPHARISAIPGAPDWSSAMPAPLRPFVLVAAVLFAFAAGGPAARADAFTPAQRAEIVQIMRQALQQDPSILRDAIGALQADEAKRQAAAVQPGDPMAGNPKGNVTIVEFFDVRCPYCRQMNPVLAALLRHDHEVRVIYKDLAILGPASVLASRALLAAQPQDGYLKLRAALMAGPPDITDATIQAAATKLGLDWPRLRRDMAAPTIMQRLRANVAQAQALGIDGTPAFLVGHTLIPGAVDLADLEKAVAAARSQG